MKSQKIIRLLALVLVLVFATAAFAACGGDDADQKTPATSDGAAGSEAGKSFTTPLVVAYNTFSQLFSPFFAATGYDQDVAGMTQLGTMTTTRSSAIVYNAIEGEKEVYNGTEYEYKGVADLSVVQNQAANQTVYTLKIRDDLKFSDGVAATIDDVIFYYYVILDPHYTGSSTLSSIDIVGLEEYLYDNSLIGSFDADQYVAEIDQHADLQQAVIDKLIKPGLTGELEWVKNNVLGNADYAAYTAQSQQAKDVLYIFYGSDPTLVSAEGVLSDALLAMTEEQILNKLFEEYGYDYVKYGINYGADFSGDVLVLAKEIGATQLTNGQKVPNIAGIKRIDDYTVEVTTEGYAANAVYQIGSATITPRHYYGDINLWDYANNKFGFNNRADDSMAMIEAKNAQPMGAGPYKFVKFEDKVVYFEANENYWAGEPYIKNIHFKETTEEDKVAALDTGDADIANEVSGSVAKLAEISKYNSNGQPTGDKITSSFVWNLGYGYIGMNADNMKVGDDKESLESKSLRKAIATIISANRDTAIQSYYGDSAEVIEYPISSTSWAAPQPGDTGYVEAYSVDATGASIYTPEMTADQRRAAAIQAAISFLKQAGFTFDEAQQKFTAAPTGAKLSYEIIVPADGGTDHPAIAIVTESQKDFASIGLELKLNNPATSQILWDTLDASEQELWAAAWGSTIDPDMYQVYHSSNIVGKPGATGSNHYHIESATLDNLIITARQSDDQNFRKTMYKQALDELMDWAVEIPTYQRKNLVCFSTERVNMASVTPDITTYWGWMAEIETLELNAD